MRMFILILTGMISTYLHLQKINVITLNAEKKFRLIIKKFIQNRNESC